MIFTSGSGQRSLLPSSGVPRGSGEAPGVDFGCGEYVLRANSSRKDQSAHFRNGLVTGNGDAIRNQFDLLEKPAPESATSAHLLAEALASLSF